MWHPLTAGLFFLFLVVLFRPLLIYLYFSNTMVIFTWDLLSIMSQPLSISILLDSTGITLIVTVIFIASNVLFFAATYILGDKFINRFIGLVVSFVVAMCLLVILPNIFTLLIGWDGLGLTSYLLVLYYQTPKSQSAAMITAITNRLGDIFILFSIAWSINTHWLPLCPWSSFNDLMLSSLLVVAAITKRAQYPFISWLPAAMAAPTPVSALVHSSTLVTAGVFILVRFFNALSSWSLNYILLPASCLTALIAGLSALAECDIKKIIALSTLSQLGTIIFRLSIGIPYITFFHLVTHALFKALLFITAGILIHFHGHTQDLRAFGQLPKTAPFLVAILTISNLALIGIPFIAGFYSKDLIIEFLISSSFSYFWTLLFLLATSLTTIYTVRFLINTVWAPRNTPPASPYQPKINILIILPIINLSFATIVIGPFLIIVMITPQIESTLPIFLKLQALLVIFLGITLGVLISSPITRNAFLIKNKFLNHFLTSIAFATPINSQVIARFPIFIGHIIQKSLDGGWVESLGGQGSLLSLTPLREKSSSSLGKSLSANIIIIVIISILIYIYILFKSSLNEERHTEDVEVRISPFIAPQFS